MTLFSALWNYLLALLGRRVLVRVPKRAKIRTRR